MVFGHKRSARNDPLGAAVALPVRSLGCKSSAAPRQHSRGNGSGQGLAWMMPGVDGIFVLLGLMVVVGGGGG